MSWTETLSMSRAQSMNQQPTKQAWRKIPQRWCRVAFLNFCFNYLLVDYRYDSEWLNRHTSDWSRQSLPKSDFKKVVRIAQERILSHTWPYFAPANWNGVNDTWFTLVPILCTLIFTLEPFVQDILKMKLNSVFAVKNAMLKWLQD